MGRAGPSKAWEGLGRHKVKGKTEEESDVRTAPVLPAIQGRGEGQPPLNLNLKFLKETLTEQFSRVQVDTKDKEAQ